jgi:dTDP-4-amino-4,6-dideoxygalactose transaminase
MTGHKKTAPIYVTQPLLPPLEEFLPYLQQIWENKRLTNGGPFHQQLEQALCDYLGVNHLALFTNGTIALVTALQALRITGEVITTPYSFVATSHSLLWNGIKLTRSKRPSRRKQLPSCRYIATGIPAMWSVSSRLPITTG